MSINNKTIAYMSLGCKVNLYESVAIVNMFIENGFTLVDFNENASIYIINTCTVTQTSDSKSKKMIRQAAKKNPNAIICVMGCYSQLNPQEALAIDNVNIVTGSSNRIEVFNKAMELYNQNDYNTKYLLNEEYPKLKCFEELNVNCYHDKTRGFVKIQDGCENFCSYCTIPFSRGLFRSRNKDAIIKEIQTLTNNGMKEIVLTGINTGAYGKDFGDYNFPNLLEDICLNVNNLGRLRISSIEATEVNDELLRVIKKYEKHFCMHLHIPLQGGSDEILKKMNRKYDLSFYQNVIENVRSYFPLINITADLLCGFNGETDELFNKSYEFIDNMKYGETHVFPYSPRPKTKAYLESKKINFKDSVNSITKKYRVNELLLLNEKNSFLYRERFVNKEVEVIVEKIENGIAFGHSSNYLEITFNVINAKENDLVNVIVIEANYPISKGIENYVIK